jgi:riboflavin kinase/FMN adenylyltransferase
MIGGESMRVIRLSYPIDITVHYPPVSLAVGFFDGVHRGHQVVIRDAIKKSERLGVHSGVMTFDPHPKSVLGSKEHVSSLTPISEKLQIFEDMGIDLVYVVAFNECFSKVSPSDFVEHLLIPLQIKNITVGFDFSFGKYGHGKAHDLKRMAKNRFQVKVIPSVNSNSEKISSTNIRKALEAGNIQKVNEYLGRKYTIQGCLHENPEHFYVTSASVIPSIGEYLVIVKIKDHWISGTLTINHYDKNLPYPLHFNQPPVTFPETLKIELIRLPSKESKLVENPIII